MPPEAVIKHLDAGCSLSGTARLVQVSKATVARLLRVAGRHAQRFHGQWAQGLTPLALQFDEQWRFCQTKQRRCGPQEAQEWGDMWDHVAIDPISKLIVTLSVGKRTEDQTRALVLEAQIHLCPGWLPAIFIDAYAPYMGATLEAFGHRYAVPRRGNRGRRLQPRLRCRRGLVYAQVKKHYRGRRVERVDIRPV